MALANIMEVVVVVPVAAALLLLACAAVAVAQGRRRRPLVVAIDGTIAVGKSTVCEALRRAGWVVRTEGADDDSRWMHALRLFYTDPGRYAFLLQVAILEDMRTLYRDLVENGAGAGRRAVVVERSPLSAEIFIQNSLRAGHLCHTEHATYQRLRAHLGWVPDVVISLDCPVETSIARMRRRARGAEGSVDEAYLRTMDRNYRQSLRAWRARIRTGQLAVRAMYVVDAAQGPDAVAADVARILRSL